MSKLGDIFGEDLFQAYRNTSGYRDSAMMEIMIRKEEFEKNLDSMWSVYQSGVTPQIVNYKKQVDMIKDTGLKVLRNPAGKHKIVSR